MPTNHDDPSEGVTSLYVVKVPALASAGSRLGSVYTNPGGPGASGTRLCSSYGNEWRDLVGGRFDIICFDPRGIERSGHVDCYGSAAAQRAALGNTVLDQTFEVPDDPGSEAGKAVLVEQQRQVLAQIKMQADLCGRVEGAERLKWMGTTTLVRDMEYLKTALDGEEALINYMGGSYGTIVGQ